MRVSAQFREVHKAADRIEPRVARAVRSGMDRLRSKVPLQALAEAIEVADEERVVGLLDFDSALEPSAAILRDALVRGGRIAARELP